MNILYHASPHTDLQIIKPTQILLEDNVPIGKYVFATDNIKYASMYLVKLGHATLMEPNGKNPHIIIQSEPDVFSATDKGGAIYFLPDTTFKETPQNGLEQTERVSRESVEPIDKRIYKSSIEAMSEMGIKIYFVNRKTFKLFLETKDDEGLLNLIQPYKVAH